MNFLVLKAAVAKQYALMEKHQLFRVGVSKDELYETYQSSFPAGSNPIFRTRAEHDCTCCKQFIRAIGNVVAVINGQVQSIWDVVLKDEPEYQIVANAMAKLVKTGPILNDDGLASGEIGAREIVDYFLHDEKSAGTDRNFDQLLDPAGKPIAWNHFFANINAAYVVKKADIATRLGAERDLRSVFDRGLRELTMDAVQSVQELINTNSILRGAENKFAVDEFAKHLKAFNKLPAAEQATYAWLHATKISGAVAKINGSNIGTLLKDLSGDVDLTVAVAKYEDKANGGNYKRTTKLATKGMIESAKKTLADAGLTSAMKRRYANVRDITVNNLIYVDRSTRQAIEGDAFDELIAAAGNQVKSKSLDKVQEMTIEAFLRDVVPTSTSIELLLENSHAGMMVSLIAPEDPTAGNLFKWDNKFSWSYVGEMADSIKERVKQAGGSVVGDLCCRLAWYNHDDLDLHMIEPDGYHIYFSTRHTTSPSGGKLDVDMNAGFGSTRTPVENIFYTDRRKMKEGEYTLKVNNFSARETKDVGFEVEMDFMGTIHNFAFPQAVANKALITVVKFKYTHKNGIEFLDGGMASAQATRTVWGLPTQTFHKVNALMLSPNHWDDQGVGNKHYFFMLDKCVNDDSARGFYNEFLKQDLEKHRHVFEMVGAKMKVDDATDQLSGLGFSSTQRNTAVVRVKGSFTRTLRLSF